MDVLIAAVALVLLAPLMLAVAGLIWAKMGRPVVFSQDRPGKDERIFTLWKFRTMRMPSEGCESDGERLTPFGSFLRKTSIDELPQLLNVLVGDMSLVGPRPLRVEYLPLYNEDQARRHLVRPGLTGLAQVAGRNLLSWEEKFALDVKYVDTWTNGMDLRILLRTVGVVLLRRGISHEGAVTMPKFTGMKMGGQK